jgi:hypothetical protein
MRKRSKAANEPADLWVRRIAAAIAVWRRGQSERDLYKEAANLSFPALVPGAGANELGLEAPHVDQIDVNFSRRYLDWMQSQATDENPIITYPRDAEGDEDVATMNERLLLRVWNEAGGTSQFRAAIPSLCTQGSTTIWVGQHSDIVSRKGLMEMSVDPELAVQEALEGEHTPRAGQDHENIVAALEGAAGDEDAIFDLDDDQFESLLEAADDHDDLAARERKGPFELRASPRKVWIRRLPVGTWCVWDHSVWDEQDKRWLARKLVYTKEEALQRDEFDRAAVNKLEPQPITQEEGYEPLDSYKWGDDPDADLEDKRLVIWEVWDKRYRTRHYVSEGCEYYLEKDETYPYLDANYEPIVRGFFPCRIIAPLLSDDEKPERTHGLPLFKRFWPQQEELIKLHSYELAQAKRHALRIYEYDENLDEDTIAALSAGIDGTMVRRDPSTDPGKTVVPVQFHSSALDISRLMQSVWSVTSSTSGMPWSDISSAPVADTATQEMQAIQAGRQQAGDVIRQLEIAAADVLEIVRDFLRGYYSDEQIAQLLGFKWVEKFHLWKRSSLEGDRLDVKFAARAKAESAVRLKQMMEAYSLLKQEIDPFTMQPKYRTDHLLAEILRGLGAGDLIPWQPTEQEAAAMQAAQEAAMLAQQQPGEEQQQGTGLPQQRDAAGNPTNGQVATTGNLLSAAARAAPQGGRPMDEGV